jgi:hypothetical protein
MAYARSGQYCLGSVTAVAIAAVLGCLVAGPYAPKVCLNKINHPFRQADLFSISSTSLRPEIRSLPTRLHHRSTPTPPPPSNLRTCRSRSNQVQLFWALTRWAHLPPGIDIEPFHSPPTTSFQQILWFVGAISINGFVAPPSTVARRGFSICLYAPPAPLLAIDDELILVSAYAVVLIWSLDHFVIRSSLKDRLVSWLLNL